MMEWSFLDTWIVIIGMLSAASCALLGNYLVLRRMSMMGDAISHAVLPGLAIAFLLTHSRDSLPMLLGAVVIGIVTSLLIQGIDKLSGLDKGASMGVVFTTLFALGLILIRQAADHVDLDPGCVLYGAIELTPLDTYTVAGIEIPYAAVTTGSMLLVNLIFILVFYKELKITSFDPAIATTMGINANAMHYLLMTLVAATTIAAFESVGSIIVIAMLIVPAAAAHLLTDRLSVMLIISVVFAALAAFLGHVGAITVPVWFGFRDTSTAGMMAVAAGVLFVLVMVGSPRYGLLSRMANRMMLAWKIDREDLLGFLFRFQELKGDTKAVVPFSRIKEAFKLKSNLTFSIRTLVRQGLVKRSGADLALTPAGLAAGKNLIRSHRLWETYLTDTLGYDEDARHRHAHKLEHFTPEGLQEELDEAMGQPDMPPHPKQIPRK